MQDAPDTGVKDQVREFWDADPCGYAHGEAEEGTPEFYAQIERRRHELEPFIADYADFTGTQGKRVLEIGVGMGTDFIQFVRAGAVATGVDLTPRSIELVRRRVELEGLEAELRTADAETLPFEDGTFDRVYSWGVLHHTPDTGRAVREAMRVAKPGGELCVMLYGRRSWVALGVVGPLRRAARPPVALDQRDARRAHGEPGHQGLHQARAAPDVRRPRGPADRRGEHAL